jgi:MSP (Major sperm protein) domain
MLAVNNKNCSFHIITVITNNILFTRCSGSFTEPIPVELKMINPSDLRVGFKIKTTAPKQYTVRPSSGIVNPGDAVVVTSEYIFIANITFCNCGSQLGEMKVYQMSSDTKKDNADIR